MKRLVLFFLCYPVCLYGQWCIDFEDRSLSHWDQGRDSSWQIQPEGSLSGFYSLHHSMDDSVGNHDQIALPLDSSVSDMLTFHLLQTTGLFSWQLTAVNLK
jgi:hypothetical protein